MRNVIKTLAATLAVLTGCVGSSYEGDENSPYYLVPVGSRLLLTQELAIAPDQTGVYVQNGRVRLQTELQSGPHCRFYVYTLQPVERKVAPDEFIVTKTVQHEIRGAALTAQLASDVLPVSRQNGGGSSVHTFITRMDLQSAKQPDVFRLQCAQLGYPGIDRHVTIAEIRRTLGNLITLRLAGTGA